DTEVEDAQPGQGVDAFGPRFTAYRFDARTHLGEDLVGVLTRQRGSAQRGRSRSVDLQESRRDASRETGNEFGVRERPALQVVLSAQAATGTQNGRGGYAVLLALPYEVVAGAGAEVVGDPGVDP